MRIHFVGDSSEQTILEVSSVEDRPSTCCMKVKKKKKKKKL